MTRHHLKLVSERQERETSSMLQAFRAGDDIAVGEVEERVRRIIGYRGYGIPEPQRDEIRQEVLIQVWRAVNKESFDEEQGFWGFVQVVATRRCIDWRRRSRETSLDEPTRLPGDQRGPLAALLVAERQRQASDLFLRLGSTCRHLVQLRLAEDKSYSEIARLTNRSEDALRAQMYRCIKKLRAIAAPSEESSL